MAENANKTNLCAQCQYRPASAEGEFGEEGRMTFLDLFSGIGGFSLGLESVGMRCVLQCEIEPFCRKVLAKHWPHVERHDDIQQLSADTLRQHAGAFLVCGGFPCQGISSAGKRRGLDDERSALAWEMLRVIGLVKPRWLLIENVPDLRTKGYDRLADRLEGDGYTLWPFVVGAYAVGATHRRNRVWIFGRAFDAAQGRRNEDANEKDTEGSTWRSDSDAADDGASHFNPSGKEISTRITSGSQSQFAAALRGHRWPARLGEPKREDEPPGLLTEPPLVQFVHGVPRELARRDRALKRAKVAALGNAVVPQVVAAIGRAIIAAEENLQRVREA